MGLRASGPGRDSGGGRPGQPGGDSELNYTRAESWIEARLQALAAPQWDR